MSDAGRSPVLPEAREPIASDVEPLASAYLDAAGGNPSVALRLALADSAAEQRRLAGRLEQLQALVSRGFARWGHGHG